MLSEFTLHWFTHNTDASNLTQFNLMFLMRPMWSVTNCSWWRQNTNGIILNLLKPTLCTRLEWIKSHYLSYCTDIQWNWDHTKLYSTAGEPFSGHVPKLSTNFKEILLCPYGNSEEKNKVLEPSITINY